MRKGRDREQAADPVAKVMRTIQALSKSFHSYPISIASQQRIDCAIDTLIDAVTNRKRITRVWNSFKQIMKSEIVDCDEAKMAAFYLAQVTKAEQSVKIAGQEIIEESGLDYIFQTFSDTRSVLNEACHSGNVRKCTSFVRLLYRQMYEDLAPIFEDMSTNRFAYALQCVKTVSLSLRGVVVARDIADALQESCDQVEWKLKHLKEEFSESDKPREMKIEEDYPKNKSTKEKTETPSPRRRKAKQISEVELKRRKTSPIEVSGRRRHGTRELHEKENSGRHRREATVAPEKESPKRVHSKSLEEETLNKTVERQKKRQKNLEATQERKNSEHAKEPEEKIERRRRHRTPTKTLEVDEQQKIQPEPPRERHLHRRTHSKNTERELEQKPEVLDDDQPKRRKHSKTVEAEQTKTIEPEEYAATAEEAPRKGPAEAQTIDEPAKNAKQSEASEKDDLKSPPPSPQQEDSIKKIDASNSEEKQPPQKVSDKGIASEHEKSEHSSTSSKNKSNHGESKKIHRRTVSHNIDFVGDNHQETAIHRRTVSQNSGLDEPQSTRKSQHMKEAPPADFPPPVEQTTNLEVQYESPTIVSDVDLDTKPQKETSSPTKPSESDEPDPWRGRKLSVTTSDSEDNKTEDTPQTLSSGNAEFVTLLSQNNSSDEGQKMSFNSHGSLLGQSQELDSILHESSSEGDKKLGSGTGSFKLTAENDDQNLSMIHLATDGIIDIDSSLLPTEVSYPAPLESEMDSLHFPTNHSSGTHQGTSVGMDEQSDSMCMRPEARRDNSDSDSFFFGQRKRPGDWLSSSSDLTRTQASTVANSHGSSEL